MLYYVMICYIVVYYIILYYVILYYIILYYGTTVVMRSVVDRNVVMRLMTVDHNFLSGTGYPKHVIMTELLSCVIKLSSLHPHKHAK